MKELYEYLISDVAMEISVDSFWREKIFSLKDDEILYISYKDADLLPTYIRQDILDNKLIFCAEIVSECPESYDEGLIIFKFFAKDFPEICSYSGNNFNIV